MFLNCLVAIFKNIFCFSSCPHREQMQKVFVGLKRRLAAVNGQQVVDVAVQVLQFAQVDLFLVYVVRQRLVERDQVLQVDTQDGHLEAPAFVVDPPVVAVVAPRREEFCEFTQDLLGNKERKNVRLHQPNTVNRFKKCNYG